MPYASIDELPPSVTRRLPQHAQEIYVATFNNAWKGPGWLDEARAHRIAWASEAEVSKGREPMAAD
jgi:cation transport regulator